MRARHDDGFTVRIFRRVEAGFGWRLGLAGTGAEGGDAICLVSTDGNTPDDVLAKVRALPLVMQASTLAF